MSNIVFVNGSPKGKVSTSNEIINIIKHILDKDINTDEVIIADRNTNDEDKFIILDNADKIILIFPMYVDCLPSIVIGFLERYEKHRLSKKYDKNTILYAITNLGFIEGEQGKYVMQVIKNYSDHFEHINYGGGLSIGAGTFLVGNYDENKEKKIIKDMSIKFREFISIIEEGKILEEDIFSSPNMSKKMYCIAGNNLFAIMGMKNKNTIGKLKRQTYKVTNAKK